MFAIKSFIQSMISYEVVSPRILVIKNKFIITILMGAVISNFYYWLHKYESLINFLY